MPEAIPPPTQMAEVMDLERLTAIRQGGAPRCRVVAAVRPDSFVLLECTL
jgi:hypothetical protein